MSPENSPYAIHLWYLLDKTYNPPEILKQFERYTSFSAHFSFLSQWANPAIRQNELQNVNFKQSLRIQRHCGYEYRAARTYTDQHSSAW